MKKAETNNVNNFRIIIKGRVEQYDKIELKEISKLKLKNVKRISDLHKHFFSGESAAAFYYNSYILSLLKNEINDREMTEIMASKVNAIELFGFLIDFTRLLIWLDKETQDYNAYSREIIDYNLIDFTNFTKKEEMELLKSYLIDITKNNSFEVISENLNVISHYSETLYDSDLTEIYNSIYQLVRDNKEVFQIWNSFKNERESRRCVAYFESACRHYISFSGASVNYIGHAIDGWKNLYSEIEKIVGDNIFTGESLVFCNLKDDCKRWLELDGTTKLSQPATLSDNYDPNNKNKLNQAFSCCERKIVSYLKNDEELIRGIIRYKPCNKCIPALTLFDNLDIQVPEIDVFFYCMFDLCKPDKISINRYKINGHKLEMI